MALNFIRKRLIVVNQSHRPLYFGEVKLTTYHTLVKTNRLPIVPW